MAITITGMPAETPPAVRAAAIRRTDAAIAAARRGPLPQLDAATGALPAGIYHVSWEEFVSRFGSTPWRAPQLGNLQRTMVALARAGVEQLVVGGSFVTAKVYNGDLDVAQVVRGGDPQVTVAAQNAVALNGGGSMRGVNGMPAHTVPFAGPGAGGTYLELLGQSKGGGPARGVVLLDTAATPGGTGAGAGDGLGRVLRAVGRFFT